MIACDVHTCIRMVCLTRLRGLRDLILASASWGRLSFTESFIHGFHSYQDKVELKTMSVLLRSWKQHRYTKLSNILLQDPSTLEAISRSIKVPFRRSPLGLHSYLEITNALSACETEERSHQP